MNKFLALTLALALPALAHAANFQAVAAGDWHTTNTWGVTSIPGASDNVDLNGAVVTQTGTVTCASLVDVATGGTLTLGANASFTCRAVTNAPLETASAGVVLDCDYTLTTGNGLMILAGGEATIAGAWINSGGGSGIDNEGGTVTDFSGSIVNSGAGYGAYNYAGTWTDFSGTLNNVGNGYGAYNDGGTWTDFFGTLNNTGGGIGVFNVGAWDGFHGTLNNSATGYGINNNSGGTWSQFEGQLVNSATGIGVFNNYGTWTDFSGMLVSSSLCYAVDNYGTWTDFSGTLELNSLAASAISGPAIPFSGIIKIAAQADLAAGNILVTKTILGTAGSFNETARNTDPGEANVKSGTSYKIGDASKTGTLVTGSSKPGFGGGFFNQ